MIQPKLIRITTVPHSLRDLQKGQNKFLKSKGFDILGVSSSGEALEDVKKNEEIRIQVVEMTRIISPLKDLKALWNFYKICKKEKPDIVHSHTPKAGIVGMLGAKLAGVSIRMHTIAGLPLTETRGAKRKILTLVEKFTYACATNLYPISYGLRDYILKENLTFKSKVKIIGNGSSNGIDVHHFNRQKISEETKQSIRKNINIGPNEFVFLFVGRVVADKGVNELVQTFSEINSSIPNIHLVIVGDFEKELDPLKPEIESLMKNCPNIHAVGYKNNVEEYFAIADIFVFPSYREGFGNVTAQAGAMELPVIATDITGSNEIIIDGENGWIVPPKNVEKLKERMIWCYEHSEESKAMGIKSRKLIQEKYDRHFVWKELLKEYETLLKEEN